MERRNSSTYLGKNWLSPKDWHYCCCNLWSTDALANMGYLDTRKHTSNNLEYTKMVCPNYKGEKFYELGSAVSDANLVTASGIAPLEFAREVLKK